MKCRNCPYGKEDFARRMGWYNKTTQEQGIPNDIYGNLQPEDAADEFEKFLWCDKVGGKVYWAYKCTDADFLKKGTSDCIRKYKKKRGNKRERDHRYNNHLKYLYKVSRNHFCVPVIYTNKLYIREQECTDNSKPYYKRIYRGNGKNSRLHYCKKMSNRKIRRYKGELHNKGFSCHKLYDFW